MTERYDLIEIIGVDNNEIGYWDSDVFEAEDIKFHFYMEILQAESFDFDEDVKKYVGALYIVKDKESLTKDQIDSVIGHGSITFDEINSMDIGSFGYSAKVWEGDEDDWKDLVKLAEDQMATIHENLDRYLQQPQNAMGTSGWDTI